MQLRRTVSIVIAALAMAGGVAACGEEDVDRGVDKATDEASQVGKEAKDEAGEVGKDVEKEVQD